MKKVQKGFTLIELMIVVAIIGILASIAIPQYGNYISRTKATGSIADIEVLKLGVGLCRQFAGSFDDCDAAAGTPSTDGNVPSAEATEFLVGTAVTDGIITATSTANTTGGVALTIDLRPTYTAGEGQISWDMDAGATICDATRGIAPDRAGCGP